MTPLISPTSVAVPSAASTDRSAEPLSRHTIAPTTALTSQATSFGTLCPGLDFDNTYKLGSDWVDVDGALASAVNNGKDMPVITAPSTVSAAENSPLVTVTATATDDAMMPSAGPT